MTKEQVYDATIMPLMAQIIEVCQAHGIAMLADFVIDTAEQPDLRCTSLTEDGQGNIDQRHHMAFNILGINTSTMIITSEQADGSKQITAVLS